MGEKVCAPDGICTRDLILSREPLWLLSYGGAEKVSAPPTELTSRL